MAPAERRIGAGQRTGMPGIQAARNRPGAQGIEIAGPGQEPQDAPDREQLRDQMEILSVPQTGS